MRGALSGNLGGPWGRDPGWAGGFLPRKTKVEPVPSEIKIKKVITSQFYFFIFISEWVGSSSPTYKYICLYSTPYKYIYIYIQGPLCLPAAGTAVGLAGAYKMVSQPREARASVREDGARASVRGNGARARVREDGGRASVREDGGRASVREEEICETHINPCKN